MSLKSRLIIFVTIKEVKQCYKRIWTDDILVINKWVEFQNKDVIVAGEFVGDITDTI